MFVFADARRFPMVEVTVMLVFVVPPLVVISLPANRVLPLHPLVMLTRVSSAFAKERTRSASALACACERKSASETKRDLVIYSPLPVDTMFTFLKRAGGQP